MSQSCGAEICARNTWVRHGVSGEKVGDRLILKVKPAGAGHWSGNAFDPQRKQNYAINVHVTAKHMTTRGMRDGRVHVSKHGLERARIDRSMHDNMRLQRTPPRYRFSAMGAERSQSPSPIHEQQHPGGDERRHRDEIGDLKRYVLPEQNSRHERASNRQFLNVQHRIGDELEIIRV